jgi:hypothetical protein
VTTRKKLAHETDDQQACCLGFDEGDRSGVVLSQGTKITYLEDRRRALLRKTDWKLTGPMQTSK